MPAWLYRVFFAYHGLGRYFKDTECYGNNELEKSENIKLIVERNNIDEAVYVGDIQGDYDSSKRQELSSSMQHMGLAQ